MQTKSPSSLKIPTISPINPIYKGVVTLPRKPYHSFRARSLSLTPYTQANLINACSSFSSSSSSVQGSKMSSYSLNEIPLLNIYNNNESGYYNYSPSSDLNKSLFESKTQPFPDIHDPSFDKILQIKLEICSYIFDFSKDDQIEQREIKTEALEHILGLFQDKIIASLLNPFQQQAIFRMIERNIFQIDPKFPTFTPVIEHLPPFSEPSWPHRSISYQILIQFIQLFPDAQCININIVKKIICHFQLPDPNERLQLVVFLKKYIELHEKEHAPILFMIKNAMIFLNDEFYNGYCLVPIISIFSHIILKYYSKLKEEILNVFFEAFVPLVSYNYASLSFQHFKNVFLLMIRTDRDLAYLILKKLQKLWPHQNNSKQAAYTDLLISISASLDHRIFEKFSLNFFSFLRDLLFSQQFKLVDTIINIFVNESYSSWLTENSTILIDKLFEPISIISILSSDKLTKNKCMNALKTMSTMNNSEFNKCELVFKNKQKVLENQLLKMSKNKNQPNQYLTTEKDDKNVKIIQSGIDNNFFFTNSHDLKKEKRHRDIWMNIINNASMNNYSLTSEKQNEINSYFDQEQKSFLTISRFLPNSLNQVEPVKKISCSISPQLLTPLSKFSKPKRLTMRASVPKCIFYSSLAKSETNLFV